MQFNGYWLTFILTFRHCVKGKEENDPIALDSDEEGGLPGWCLDYDDEIHLDISRPLYEKVIKPQEASDSE